MLVGGDKLRAHPRTTLPFELINSYGPTECTVDSTWYGVPSGTAESGAPPIGRPIDNYRAYIVDERMQPVPVGVTGELLIGGVGVARGYLNRPELDAEKFVPDVFGPDPGAKLYRTGDQTRHRPDGEIEYVGRIDDQVQIRGYRVEPGEVEAVLVSHRDVASVAVLAREDKPGRVRLVAYVTSRAALAEELAPALRDFAASRLPDYMVPAVVVLDSLPVNLNGKIDRKALRPPEEYASWTADVSVPPRDPIEARLVEIWEEVLEVGGIGIRDGFFALGGDSLSIVTMLAAAEKVLEAKISLPALLREPTVEGLARIVRGDSPDARPFVVPLREGGPRAPFFCVAGAGGGCHWFGDLALALRPDRPFLGLEPVRSGTGHASTPADGGVEAIAAALVLEMRRVQPAGPYLIGGYSFGGLVAFEIAQQLLRAGEGVGLLALIECDGAREFHTRAGQVGLFVRNLLALDASRAARVLLARAAYALSLARHRLRQTSDERDVVKQIDLQKEADVATALAYRPSPYPGDVALFTCSDRPMTAVVDERGGWGGVVRGSLHVERVPGDHYTMLAPPNVAVLADALQRALDGCRASDASLDPQA
ncbi:MAG: AMP-binding protein [Deltaproteobacteria bacterium]|nr:AMP-binding protein [Deltaproteobacteria bacterium]